MNPSQEKFFNFILDRTKNEKQEVAKALLKESFEKQVNGTFNAEYARGFAPKMIALLKPEYIEEVSAIMTQFGQRPKQ